MSQGNFEDGIDIERTMLADMLKRSSCFGKTKWAFVVPCETSDNEIFDPDCDFVVHDPLEFYHGDNRLCAIAQEDVEIMYDGRGNILWISISEEGSKRISEALREMD